MDSNVTNNGATMESELIRSYQEILLKNVLAQVNNYMELYFSIRSYNSYLLYLLHFKNRMLTYITET